MTDIVENINWELRNCPWRINQNDIIQCSFCLDWYNQDDCRLIGLLEDHQDRMLCKNCISWLCHPDDDFANPDEQGRPADIYKPLQTLVDKEGRYIIP